MTKRAGITELIPSDDEHFGLAVVSDVLLRLICTRCEGGGTVYTDQDYYVCLWCDEKFEFNYFARSKETDRPWDAYISLNESRHNIINWLNVWFRHLGSVQKLEINP